MSPHLRLVTTDMADRDSVRVRLRHDLNRVATAVWWGVYTIEDAVAEIRGQAYIIAELMRIPTESIDAVAVAWLDDEIARHEAEHLLSVDAMASAALIMIRDGASRVAIRHAVASAARERPLMPPLYLLDQALEEAAKRHRMTIAWWKKRERSE